MTRTGLLLTALCCLILSGCGYTLGTPIVPGVRSVHVPLFRSESFRRDTDYLLTEAVQREIRTRGGYRLEDAATADTILTGKIVEIRKSPLSETRFDDPRELQLSLGAEVTWMDRRTGKVLIQQTFPLTSQLMPQMSSVSMAPEVGQSFATAQQEAARRLASSIADLMEIAW
ncbi:MAG: LPS assembly lipoprotein LptE [Planctomyces sp.]